ncbi:hypothetical protein AWB99_21120 [Mycolicibacterium confluentis]|nr:hypothetical protein AWB99_21120 [Mycolicibacterium confluentis]
MAAGKNTLSAMGFHHGRLDVDDVGTGLLRAQRQVQAVLGRGRRGAGLHDEVGVERAPLLDRDHQQALPLVDGE